MKKVLFLFVLLLIFSVSILSVAKPVFAESLSNKLKGKILLQVESKGEAWYVSPSDGKRHSMGKANDAFSLMRQLGVGISNDNLKKIKIANENLSGLDSDNDGLSDMAEDAIGTDKNKIDSDSDGFNDKDETMGGYDPSGSGKLSLDNNFSKSQSGKILLQVEKHGEAWYVNPSNFQRYFMGRPGDAFNLMRKLGLGITNNDLNKIAESVAQANILDIDKVKDILKDIRQGYLTGDNTLVTKHASAQTATFLSGATQDKQDKVNSFTVNNVVQSGQYIVANWTAVLPSGKPDTYNMVFIKEAGNWKFDMSATVQWAKDQSNAKKGKDDPSGLPDLVVIKAVVYPSHPIVNNKDIEIDITIKNVGTKTSDSGAPLTATLLGFVKQVPVQGGPLFAITPGESVIWTFRPYTQNEFFKISDTGGQKTIQIELNKDREVAESNYDNNIFTQTVQVYNE